MIQPYVGVGIGMSLGSVSSPYILQEGGGSLDEFTVGFLLRSPIIGVRVNVGDSTTLFIEQRSITDYTYILQELRERKRYCCSFSHTNYTGCRL